MHVSLVATQTVRIARAMKLGEQRTNAMELGEDKDDSSSHSIPIQLGLKSARLEST